MGLRSRPQTSRGVRGEVLVLARGKRCFLPFSVDDMRAVGWPQRTTVVVQHVLDPKRSSGVGRGTQPNRMKFVFSTIVTRLLFAYPALFPDAFKFLFATDANNGEQLSCRPTLIVAKLHRVRKGIYCDLLPLLPSCPATRHEAIAIVLYFRYTLITRWLKRVFVVELADHDLRLLESRRLFYGSLV
jgi:hypothetical protein